MSTSMNAHVRTLPPRTTPFVNGATTSNLCAVEPDWTGALCRRPDVDPDTWFPEGRQSPEPAKQICRGCPLRDRCLEWALATGQPYGVWGAVDERERRELRAGLLAAAEPGGPELAPVTARPPYGELRYIVAAQLDAWPSRMFTVSDLARALDRPRTSVAHALAALERHGAARQVTARPRRYASTADKPRTPAVPGRVQLRARIRGHLDAHPGQAFTSGQIADAIGADSKDAVLYQVKSMARRGLLRRVDGGRWPKYMPAQTFAEVPSCAS